MGALPESFGKYTLVERLGAGGMAEVFRAVLHGEGGFEKQLAIKRILPIFGSESGFHALFEDEARIVSSLTHANICQVFEFGEVEGARFLALELVDGLDLGHLVQRCEDAAQPFPHATAAFIIAEAARGLEYAHAKRGPDGSSLGIVHRDVSPQNILISLAGEVKITDFGIAKAQGKRHKTATGVVMGKLRYMAPEQVLGTHPLDGRADVFALGVILYELLVGGPIYVDATPVRAAELMHTQDAPPPSSRNPTVEPELDRIVAKALARNREERYGRASDLARDLSRWLTSAAPGFTREDLGALVERLAKPRIPDLPVAHADTDVAQSSGSGQRGGKAGTVDVTPSQLVGQEATRSLRRTAVRGPDEPILLSARKTAAGEPPPGQRMMKILVGALIAIIVASAGVVAWKLTSSQGRADRIVDAGVPGVVPPPDAALPAAAPLDAGAILGAPDAAPPAPDAGLPDGGTRLRVDDAGFKIQF